MPFMRVISIITIITTAIITTTTTEATLFTHFWDAKADAWKRATTEVLSFSLHFNNKKSVCVKSNWWIDTDYTNSWELHVSSKCVCFPVAVLQSCLCRCQQQQKQQQKRRDAASSTLKCYFHMYKARESVVVQCNQVDAHSVKVKESAPQQELPLFLLYSGRVRLCSAETGAPPLWPTTSKLCTVAVAVVVQCTATLHRESRIGANRLRQHCGSVCRFHFLYTVTSCQFRQAHCLRFLYVLIEMHQFFPSFFFSARQDKEQEMKQNSNNNIWALMNTFS